MFQIADGPWACYVHAVFGKTAESWREHHERYHKPVGFLASGELVRWAAEDAPEAEDMADD